MRGKDRRMSCPYTSDVNPQVAYGGAHGPCRKRKGKRRIHHRPHHLLAASPPTNAANSFILSRQWLPDTVLLAVCALQPPLERAWSVRGWWLARSHLAKTLLSPMTCSLADSASSPRRSLPLLPLLARGSRVLRRELRRGRVRQEEVHPGSGRLLRVPPPPERGMLGTLLIEIVITRSAREQC